MQGPVGVQDLPVFEQGTRSMTQPTSQDLAVTVITGAASGLGWELAQRFFKRGDALVLVDLNAELLAQRVAELDAPGRILHCAGDITDGAFPTQLRDRISERFGRVDTLVNNAGITHRSAVRETDLAVFARVMAVDWQAPVALTVALLPMLEQSRGQIVNIGSMAGWMPVPGRAAYCAAKSALAQFFEVLRLESEDRGIHILNVYPSFLDTPIEQNALGGRGQRAGHARSTVGTIRGADWMAARVLVALEARKPWLFPDRLSWLGSLLWRIWPRQYLATVRRRFASELRRS